MLTTANRAEAVATKSRASVPDGELRVLAEAGLRSSVVEAGEVAEVRSGRHPCGTELGYDAECHVGMGTGSLPRVVRPDESGTAGVRIRGRGRRGANQPERQHNGGNCCRLSHCDSHCGFLSSLDFEADARPAQPRWKRGWPQSFLRAGTDLPPR